MVNVASGLQQKVEISSFGKEILEYTDCMKVKPRVDICSNPESSKNEIKLEVGN